MLEEKYFFTYEISIQIHLDQEKGNLLRSVHYTWLQMSKSSPKKTNNLKNSTNLTQLVGNSETWVTIQTQLYELSLAIALLPKYNHKL